MERAKQGGLGGEPIRVAFSRTSTRTRDEYEGRVRGRVRGTSTRGQARAMPPTFREQAPGGAVQSAESRPLMLENEPLPSIRKRRRLFLGAGCGLGMIVGVVIWTGTALHAWHWSPWNVVFPEKRRPELHSISGSSRIIRRTRSGHGGFGRWAERESGVSGERGHEGAEQSKIENRESKMARRPLQPFSSGFAALRLQGFPAVRSNAPNVSASVRVAVVDLRRVFDSHPRTTLEASRIGQRRDEARAEIMKLQANGDEGKAFEHQERLQKDIERDSEESRREIVRTIQQIVTDSVARHGFDLVIDSSGATLNGPFLLAAPAATDLTDEIIAAVNREPFARQRANVP